MDTNSSQTLLLKQSNASYGSIESKENVQRIFPNRLVVLFCTNFIICFEVLLNKYFNFSCTVKQMEHFHNQPKWWPSMCQHRRCPTFQAVARMVAYILIGLVVWYFLYILVGDTMVPPKGKLFQIIFLTATAMVAGRLVSLTNLPALIGNLFIGALFQNCGVVDLDESFAEINKVLRWEKFILKKSVNLFIFVLEG